MIEHSIAPHGKELVTFQLRYPRFIHAEELTHRLLRTTPEEIYIQTIADGLMYDENLSRNASSSRAIPINRMIEDILRDTAMPIHWGKNQPGMQAKPENEPTSRYYVDGGYTEPGYWVEFDCEATWLEARDAAISFARKYVYAGYHKQIVNRLLEPFAHINVVVTATEWDNFYELRNHEDAQPEIQQLAREMLQAVGDSTPRQLNEGEWHLPYVLEEERSSHSIIDQLKLSTARCARTSYVTHEGKAPEYEADVALYDQLVGARPLHASPTEHQGTPASSSIEKSGNFQGWTQHRQLITF